MNRVFVDTSAFLPLMDRSAREHERVVRALALLAEEGALLVTCSYTLVETGALVKRRLGGDAFRAFGDTIVRSLEIVWVDRALHAEAWELAAQQGRHGPSLVDCVSFLLMRDLGILRALTLDGHFGARGFEVVP